VNGTVQTVLFQITSQTLCPSVVVQSPLNVVSFVAYPLASIPDPLEFQNTSIGGAFLFGGYQQVLFEATISSDNVASISGAQWTSIWIGPTGSNTVPTITNAQFLILRQGGTNVDLPGTSYSPLSNPVDEPTKLPGSAVNPSDPNEFRIRFSLNVDSQLLQNFNPDGGPNLTPFNNALSFSVSGTISVDYVKKRTTDATLDTGNTLTPTTILIIENIALAPEQSTSSHQPQKSSISSGIVAAIIVTVVLASIILAGILFVFLRSARNGASDGVFGIKGNESDL